MKRSSLFTFEQVSARLFQAAQMLELPYSVDETGLAPVLSDLVKSGQAEYVVCQLFGDREEGADIAQHVLSYQEVPTAMVAALEIAINQSLETKNYSRIAQAVRAFDLSELHNVFELYQNNASILYSLVSVTSAVSQAFHSEQETLDILRYALRFVNNEETLQYVSDAVSGLVSVTNDGELLKDALNVAEYYSTDCLATLMLALSAASNGPDLPNIPRYKAIKFVIDVAAVWKDNPELAASTLQGFAEEIYHQAEIRDEEEPYAI